MSLGCKLAVSLPLPYTRYALSFTPTSSLFLSLHKLKCERNRVSASLISRAPNSNLETDLSPLDLLVLSIRFFSFFLLYDTDALCMLI